MFLVLCRIIQADPDSPRARTPAEQPTPAGESKTINPPFIKKPLSSQEVNRRYRQRQKERSAAKAAELDLFKNMAQKLQDQNKALENASRLQQQEIDSLESHLRDAHWKMAALESRLKESEETASLESQLQLARETIAALQSRLKEREETAASNLQQQKIEFSRSQWQGAHNTIAAIRESGMTNQAINTSNTDNSWHEQEIISLKKQNSQLLDILNSAVRSRE
jgi:predicted RNase H-like nuclease (RuvC/YqgF family)